jgi:hypothetical protein
MTVRIHLAPPASLKFSGFSALLHEKDVHRPDDYTGQIVRWQIDETKKISTSGSVTNVNAFRRDRMRDEVTHPSVYRTPSYIQFTDIRIDTNQPQWTLHGVSEGKDGGFAQGLRLDL